MAHEPEPHHNQSKIYQLRLICYHTLGRTPQPPSIPPREYVNIYTLVYCNSAAVFENGLVAIGSKKPQRETKWGFLLTETGQF
jgi:hypothetical protein